MVALLEVGVTAALMAGAANWLIISHHVRRIKAAQAAEPANWMTGTGPQPRLGGPASARVGGTGPLPVLIVDETDDAGGHRIHVNPWADDSAD